MLIYISIAINIILIIFLTKILVNEKLKNVNEKELVKLEKRVDKAINDLDKWDTITNLINSIDYKLKENGKNNRKFYTLQELSKKEKLSVETIRERCNKGYYKNCKKQLYKGKYRWVVTL